MPLIKNPDGSWSPSTEITDRQIQYIESLATELELDLHRRNTHVEEILGIKIENDLHKLTKKQASEVIDKFKEWRKL